jgi:alanyl-tRNA synthetase
MGSGIVLLGATAKGKAMLICAVTKDLTDRFNAGQIIRELSGIVGGKGGGRPDMAQGGGDKPEKLADAIASLETLIVEKTV